MPSPLKNCPRCDAPLAGTETACPACKRPLAAGPALASQPQKALACPVCKIPIYAGTLDGQPAWHCAECGGLGIQRESMMKLQPYGKKDTQMGPEERGHKTPPFFEPRKKPPFLICPFCSKRMNKEKLGKAELEQCEKCDALWLERPKIELLNELIGPYKHRIARAK